MKRIVILGGGVGGVTAAQELSKELDGRAEITLVDQEGRHYFPPSYPWLVMGWRTPDQLWRPLDRLKARNVQMRKERVTAIRPEESRVETDRQVLPYDYLIVALGAQLDPRAIEGFADEAHHPYSLDGAVRLGQAVREFRGGKLLVGVSKMPFKCPAAPYEIALLIDYAFRRRGFRDRVEMEFFTPEPFPTPAAGEPIGKAVQGLLEARGIPVGTKREVAHVDASSKVVHFKGGSTAKYDLLVAVPPHTTAAAVQSSGLTKGTPWIPVDPHTLRTSHGDVYAVGDVTQVPTPGGLVPNLPKAGVFAEGQALVAARNIAAEIDGGEQARWDGSGVCFLETGFGKSGLVRGNFFGEGPPVQMRGPGRLWHWGKLLFERRWLGSHFRRA